MLDTYSFIIVIGITGLSVLLYEVLIKNHVSTRGSRVFFYIIFILHLLAFQRFSFPSELNFIGNETILNLGNLVEPATANGNRENHTKSIFLIFYLLGIAIGTIRMTLAIIRMIIVISKSSPGQHKFERYVDIPNFQPCTFFRYILIPTNLSKNVYKSVYEHEKYHVHQMHTVDMVLWHLLSILFWVNPFVHLLKSSQSRNLEYDTDKHVIKSIPKNQYSEHLLSTMFKSQTTDFYPMFNKSNIYLRIKRLNKNADSNGPWSILTLLFVAVLLFGSTIMSKASFSSKSPVNYVKQISKPEFPPNGLGHYIDSVVDARIGNRFDHIDKNYKLDVFVDIIIDEEGKVIKVTEDGRKSSQGDDLQTDNFLISLLIETIQDMPNWIPASESGRKIQSVIQEEFNFTGEGEY